MERLKYMDVTNFSLGYCDVSQTCYQASFIKYSMKRAKERQMKEARNVVLKDVENKMLESTEFN